MNFVVFNSTLVMRVKLKIHSNPCYSYKKSVVITHINYNNKWWNTFSQNGWVILSQSCSSKLLSIRKSTVKILENDQFEYFTKWYVIIIKEILSAYTFYGDFDELAKLVDPPVTALEARQSVELLERLGIVRSDNGLYIVDTRNLTTPDSWRSVAISNFQHTMIRLAIEALDRFPKETRDISTATMSISEEGIKKIKERIKLFYQDVVDIVSEDSQSSRIYELNIQLFPISKNLPGQKK